MKQIFYVSGMHCKSCELILEKEFKKNATVKTCLASSTEGRVEIDCEKEISRSDLKGKDWENISSKSLKSNK